ncbi:MAG: hypothetical protein V9E87_17575 [Gemmatimonadales bacterium]
MHPSPTRTRTPYYPNWGMSWCPVLPAVLRRAWHDVPLPWSLRNCFRRTDLTTFGALDASALLPGEILPPLGRESLAEYLGERWEEVDRLVPCSLEEWQSLELRRAPVFNQKLQRHAQRLVFVADAVARLGANRRRAEECQGIRADDGA